MKTFALAAVAFFAVTAPARADPPELVDSVQSVSVSRTDAHSVVVCARGTVMTGGYSSPRLTPARSAPHGDVYDLDFTAVRPEGIHTDMVSEISARLVWTGAPAGLNGVRVRGLRAAAIGMVGSDGGC